MNIVMASILNFERDMNGVVVSVNELISALKKHNGSIQLISPYIPQDKSVLSRIMNVTASIYRRFQTSSLALFILFLKALLIARQARKLRNTFDVFHAHDVISAAAILFSASKKHCLLSTHFHTYPWDEFAAANILKRNSFAWRLFRSFSVWVLQNRRLGLLAVSNDNAQFIMEFIPNRNPVVLYPGLKSEIISAVVKNKKDYLINVGTVNKRKNQIWLIDILAEIEKSGLIIPLVLVGQDEKNEKAKILTRIESLNIRSKIIFLGLQPKETTRKLLSNAKLYLHSSLQESFGRTLLEAISLRTPVLAREYNALSEIIDQEEIIKPDWDTSRTANFILRYLTNDNNRKRIQKKQYHRFQKIFMKEKMIETYINYLSKSGES